MKRSTLDKLRSARKALARPVERAPIIVPPSLAEHMRVLGIAISKDGVRVDPFDFFCAPPPQWPDDVTVDNPRKLAR